MELDDELAKRGAEGEGVVEVAVVRSVVERG